MVVTAPATTGAPGPPPRPRRSRNDAVDALRVLGTRARDLALRYLTELPHAWVPAVIMLVMVVALLSGLPARRGARFHGVPAAALAICVTWGIWHGWQQRWVGDDAFISFRYAANWARGHGLVWNPGEPPVEGYTNFLWTVIVGVAIKLGLDPAQTATLLGLVCYGGLIGLTHRLARTLDDSPAGRDARSSSPARAVFLIAPLLVATNPFLQGFATSGLETMFVTLSVTLAVERAHRDKLYQSGLCMTAALLAHPDQALIAAALFGGIAVRHRALRPAARFATPLLLIGLPYFAWRWHFYGDFWPNTYYAKSGGASYFLQGTTYLATAVASGGLLGVLALSLRAALRRRASVVGAGYLLALPAVLFYVAKIGGDFMNGRLLLPLLPLAFVLAADDADALWNAPRTGAAKAAARAIVALVALVPAALHVAVVLPGTVVFGIADEASFYVMTSFSPVVIDHPFFRIGKDLRATFTDRGLAARIAIANVGLAGYYSDLPILDESGLNDRAVARTPIDQRGRPGHEKFASPGRVLAWGADFATERKYPPPYGEIGTIRTEAMRLYPLRYDRTLFEALRPPLAHPDADLRSSLQALIAPEKARGASAACDVWFVDFFYLSRTTDPPLVAQAIAYAQRADPTLGDLATFSLGSNDPARAGRHEVRHFGFDRADGVPIDQSVDDQAWTATGTAFKGGISGGISAGAAYASHGQVYGAHGRLVDTFTVTEGENATGTLSSPPFLVAGDLITLAIGGGLDPDQLTVDLVIDGSVRARTASGCNTEILGRRAWNVAALKGHTARVVITDTSARAWGHVTVDDIVEWARDPSLAH
jgi:hypothetical protein